MTNSIRNAGLGLLLCLSASAQEANFQDALLDRFVGDWVLTGVIAGGEATHDISAEWILGHQYLQFHELSRETVEGGVPAYEATVTIGWDEPANRYICMWLDSTGGGGLASGVFGYAEPSDDKLAFIFADDDGRFHTTFAYDRDKDVWHSTMDAEKDGQLKPFARVTLVRKTN
jgi:hypothetical protein